MEDLIFAPLVLAIGFGIHQVVLRQHSKSFEQRLLNRSFLAHMAAAIGLILVYKYYYTFGDMLAYQDFGVPITAALRYDFGEVFPELWALFVHEEYRLPIPPLGLGSTGTMQAVSVWLFFFLGDSIFAAALFISVFSYIAKVLIYRALRSEFTPELHEKVLFASVLSPTGIVWTCALLKEPVLMVFFGPAFLGLKWILDGRLVAGALLLALGSSVILLIKPYVLIALAIAGGVWIFWARTIRAGGNVAIKPAYLGVALGLVLVGFTVVSNFVPALSPDKVAESMQSQRRVSAQEEGGSNFYLEGPASPSSEAPERGLFSQIAIMPLALVTAMFRPFIFESFSPMQFLNAIEMTWLTVMFIQMLRRNRWTDLVRRITSNPALMFCLVFVLVLGLGTGLSTANLGTLSRYRAPMMPFFLLLLVILRKPEKAAAITAPRPLLKTARA